MFIFLFFQPIFSAEDWVLAWQEEFNYTGLPNPKYWGYEVGFVRNKEKQYYMKEQLRNSRVENGQLVIEGHHDPGSTIDGQSYDYSSASIITKGKVNFQYGKIEAMFKVPAGKGVWPALWMKGDVNKSWPFCGEIDIMEYVGHTPKTLWQTVHMPGDHYPPEYSVGGSLQEDNCTTVYHNITLAWTTNDVRLFTDRKLVLQYKKPANPNENNYPFDFPLFILVNLALGGTWGGEIDNKIFDSPVLYYVDYIRYYIDNNDPLSHISWSVLNKSLGRV